VVAIPVAAGTTISTSGIVLGTASLAYGNSYLVTAAVTATAASNGSLQCQLNRQNTTTWDDIAEMDLSARSAVPLEYAYPRDGSFFPSAAYTVSLGCISTLDYVVDTGHLYITQVGSISQPGAGHVVYALPRSLRSEGLK
jgi:hypothetical protein